MRIDKFLNSVNICKRRAIALDMCQSGVVMINNNAAKPASRVKIGDIIKINYSKYTHSYEVLAIPELKNISKSDSENYVKRLSDD